jgi:uncharacterized protein
VLRVVLDVNVLISAVIRRSGVPAEIVHEWRAGRFELVISPHLLGELHDVLGRPHIVPYVTPTEAEELLAALRDIAILVENPPAERLVPNDPDDDYLVALARAGRAHVIVTGDTHLLEADLRPQAVPPRDFLTRLADIP